MNIISIIGQGPTQLVRYKLDDNMLRFKHFPASKERDAIEKELKEEEKQSTGNTPSTKPPRARKRKTQRSKKTDLNNNTANLQEK